jgi:hypothetical protein
MRTFSVGYYAKLFKVLDHLKTETKIHRFRYSFLRSSSSSSSPGDSLSAFDRNKASSTENVAPWKNGTHEIYLAGGDASAGLPLLEACVHSGLEAAEVIGAEIPLEIVRKAPF